MALGWVLFDEHIGLGLRLVPEILGIALIGAGTVGLAHAASQHETWDKGSGGTGTGGATASRSAARARSRREP